LPFLNEYPQGNPWPRLRDRRGHPNHEVFFQRGEAVQEQLAYVGEGDGIPALDALASELNYQIAEELVDGLYGG
jgi:hypothetical protein